MPCRPTTRGWRVARSDLLDPFWEQEYRQKLVRLGAGVDAGHFQPTTWEACWEHVVSGRSAAEVAAELGLTPAAVYVAKGRVLRQVARGVGRNVGVSEC